MTADASRRPSLRTLTGGTAGSAVLLLVIVAPIAIGLVARYVVLVVTIIITIFPLSEPTGAAFNASRLANITISPSTPAAGVGGAPPSAEVVTGLAGIGSPWPAPWVLAHSGTWRALLELQREIDPRTETVFTVALLAGAFA